MELAGKKLGLLVSAPPDAPAFMHAVGLARAALEKGLLVYLYLIDDAVGGLKNESLLEAQSGGMKLFACAYSLQKRHLPLETSAILAGLTILTDIIHASDRFLTFGPR